MGDMSEFVNGSYAEHGWFCSSRNKFFKEKKMKIRIPLTVTVSKKFTSMKSGSPKQFNVIEGYAPGIGIFKQFVDEKLVPDIVEGKEVQAVFAIGIDRNFNFSFRLEGFE